MSHLIGIHDIEGASIAPPDSWIIDTVALSENPTPKNYPVSLNVITRINWGYGSTGSLPPRDQYNEFAVRAARYVSGTHGCRRWVVANKTNLKREWPEGDPIYPADYAACYRLCRSNIRALAGHHNDEVLIAGSGPWNDELKYSGNERGDWVTYFTDCIARAGDVDGYAIHSYTHGYNPELVTSNARMEYPFQDRYYNFRTYRDYCDAIPLDLSHLPCYITEANGDGAWAASGLMSAMLEEIDEWNQSNNAPVISCVAFYRYPKYDHFYIEGRGDVIAEYYAAAALGYTSPMPSPIPEPPDPGPTPEPTPPAVDRYFDPALIARGVEIDTPALADGDTYWFADHLEWLDVQESGGRHHIYGNVYDETGVEMFGVRLKVSWPSGSSIVESKPDSYSPYAYNYPMSKSLNEFRIEVLDSAYKSELVTGIGMGMAGNSGIHTSTVVKWKLRTHKAIIKPPIPPIEPPIEPPAKHEGLLWPVDGPVTTWFGEGGPVFGQIGHAGIDISCPTGTSVLSVADGEVIYTGFEKDYGNYVRVWHPAYHFHSFFAHLSEIKVSVGQRVQRGQVVALSGWTGNVKPPGPQGSHLHYELRGGTRDAYYNVSYGYLQGRFDPRAAYLLTGAPLAPGGS